MPTFHKLFLSFPSNFPNTHRVELILSTHIIIVYLPRWLSGKESACNAGDTGSIPGLGISPEEMATHSSIIAWEIPWTEEICGLQFMEMQKSWTWFNG